MNFFFLLEVLSSAEFSAPASRDVQKFGTVRQKQQQAQEAIRNVSLSEWSIAQVGELFQELGASQEDIDRLASEGIDGPALVLLSYEELGTELGLKLGVRKKFALWLEQQQKNEQPKPAGPPAASVVPAAAPAAAPAATAPAPAATAPAPSKPRPGPSRPSGGATSRIKGAATIRRMSAQVDAELENMLAGLDDI